MCRITTFKLKLISLLKTIFFLKTNLNSVLRAKNCGNSTQFIWNHNSTFFCEPVWVHDNVVVTICTEPKWGAEMNLLRRNLPCKIEGKTERTRNRGRKSFLGEKIAIRGGKVIQQWRPHVRQPPGKATNLCTYCEMEKLKSPICKSTPRSILFCKEPKILNILMYFGDSFVF